MHLRRGQCYTKSPGGSFGGQCATGFTGRREGEGVAGAPNHPGKRAILVSGRIDHGAFDLAAEG